MINNEIIKYLSFNFYAKIMIEDATGMNLCNHFNFHFSKF